MIDASEEVQEFLKDTFAYVEANYFEYQTLWEKWFHESKRVTWEANLSGFLPTVAKYDNRPVCISILYAYINGKKVLFYHATSQMVFYPAIEAWLKKYLPDIIHSDAQNFHNIVHSIERENSND